MDEQRGERGKWHRKCVVVCSTDDDVLSLFTWIILFYLAKGGFPSPTRLLMLIPVPVLQRSHRNGSRSKESIFHKLELGIYHPHLVAGRM